MSLDVAPIYGRHGSRGAARGAWVSSLVTASSFHISTALHISTSLQLYGFIAQQPEAGRGGVSSVVHVLGRLSSAAVVGVRDGGEVAEGEQGREQRKQAAQHAEHLGGVGELRR